MSDLARQLGKRIYLFRKENGLTQAALAEKAKISNEFMSGIERGAKIPLLLTLERAGGTTFGFEFSGGALFTIFVKGAVFRLAG